MSEKAAVLEFQISARYGTATVLNDARATISSGEIVALVGLSGSGKSTLALSLLRLLPWRGGTVTGSIRLEGVEITGFNESSMRSLRGRRIGYVPQSPATALNEKVRVGALLDETWRAHSKARPDSSFYPRLLERVQLPGDTAFRSRYAGELSAGQGQRLLIALAIMHEPPLIIADEATSALDAITQAAVLDLFAELNRSLRTAILFITHDLLSVAAMGNRVDILHEGRIVESGSPAEIFRRPQHSFTRQLVAAMPRPPL